MNNSGALYIAHHDHAVVAEALRGTMLARHYRVADCAPDGLSGRIFVPDKPRRLFFVVPPHAGWVTVWEDPRYFGDRVLAQDLARTLATQAVWIEVSGNGVGWARGVYEGDATLEEHYEASDTLFYGEHGTLHFAFDLETTPDELIERLGLPYDELHYEAVLEGALPNGAGKPLHLAFERDAGAR